MTAGANFKRRDIITLATGLLCIATGRAYAGDDFEDPPPFETAHSQYVLFRPRYALPSAVLPMLNGKLAPVAQQRGKVQLVNVWATWCAACLADLPLLDSFTRTYGAQVGVSAISVDKAGAQDVRKFLTKLQIKNLPVFLDPDGKVAALDRSRDIPFAAAQLPATYVITPSGYVAGYVTGGADWSTPEGRNLLAYYAHA